MGSISFGPYTFDIALASLTRDGEPVSMNARGAALLASLLEARGGVLGRAALLEAGWPGLTVDEANLTVQVGILRKLLGRQPSGREWIETVPRIGYRLARSQMAAALPSVLPSVAVLRFSNLSGDKDQDYFANGVVDDVLTALARFRSFAVIGRPIDPPAGSGPAELRQLSLDLGVRYLLDGSIRRVGAMLRIAARLLGSDGRTLWSRSFDGLADDIFRFQDSITASVVAVVAPAIEVAEIERGRRERPGSIAAYDLYLRGQEAVSTHLPDRNAVAYRLFSEALALEPDNVRFLAGAALALQHRIGSGWPPLGADDRERCAELGRRGLTLVGDDAISMAFFGAGLVNAFEREVGLAALNRAVELNPNSAVVLVSAGFGHYKVGSPEEADAFFRRALVLGPDPLTQRAALIGIARGYLVGGQYEEARNWATRSLAVSEANSGTFGILIAACAHLGRMDEAQRHLARFQILAPGVTLARIAASWGNAASPNPYPERIAPILEGLKAAGMT